MDESTCQWDAPVAYPTGHDPAGPGYEWDEDNITWKLSVKG